MILSVYTYTLVGDHRLGDKRPIKLFDLKARYDLKAPHSLLERCADKVMLVSSSEVYALDPGKYEYAKDYLSITNDEIYQGASSDILEELGVIGEEYIVIANESGRQ